MDSEKSQKGPNSSDSGILGNEKSKTQHDYYGYSWSIARGSSLTPGKKNALEAEKTAFIKEKPGTKVCKVFAKIGENLMSCIVELAKIDTLQASMEKDGYHFVK